jgi:hypothetical protein
VDRGDSQLVTLAILTASESRSFSWKYHQLPYSDLAPDLHPSWNGVLCEAPIPFLIRPSRRFPVQSFATYNSVHSSSYRWPPVRVLRQRFNSIR